MATPTRPIRCEPRWGQPSARPRKQHQQPRVDGVVAREPSAERVGEIQPEPTRESITHTVPSASMAPHNVASDPGGRPCPDRGHHKPTRQLVGRCQPAESVGRSGLASARRPTVKSSSSPPPPAAPPRRFATRIDDVVTERLSRHAASSSCGHRKPDRCVAHRHDFQALREASGRRHVGSPPPRPPPGLAHR